MKYTIVATLLISAATALAGPHDDLATARQHVQAASTRISYYEMQTTIAERDVATAQIHRDTASRQVAKARRERDDAAASQWSQRHFQALQDEREAMHRATQSRYERDRARDDLHASSERVRELERVTRR